MSNIDYLFRVSYGSKIHIYTQDSEFMDKGNIQTGRGKIFGEVEQQLHRGSRVYFESLMVKLSVIGKH